MSSNVSAREMKFSFALCFHFCPCALELLFGESISCVATNTRVTIERNILDRFFDIILLSFFKSFSIFIIVNRFLKRVLGCSYRIPNKYLEMKFFCLDDRYLYTDIEKNSKVSQRNYTRYSHQMTRNACLPAFLWKKFVSLLLSDLFSSTLIKLITLSLIDHQWERYFCIILQIYLT